MADPTVLFLAGRMPQATIGGQEKWAADVLDCLQQRFPVVNLANMGSNLDAIGYYLRIGARVKAEASQHERPVIDASDCTLSRAVARAGCPSVVRANGLDITFPGPGYERMIRKYLPRITRMVANSTPTKRRLLDLGVPEDNIRIVHPHTAAPEGHTPAPEPGRVLFVGRLAPKKGSVELVQDVWPAMAAADPNIELHMVGDGVRRDALRKAIAAAPEKHRITWHGKLPRAELERQYERAQTVVMPSLPRAGDLEGFGIVNIEAAVRGVPVISYRTDGVVDAVADGITGTLVDVGDAGAFADAVVDAVQNKPFPKPAKIAKEGEARWGKARFKRQYEAVILEAAEAR